MCNDTKTHTAFHLFPTFVGAHFRRYCLPRWCFCWPCYACRRCASKRNTLKAGTTTDLVHAQLVIMYVCMYAFVASPKPTELLKGRRQPHLQPPERQGLQKKELLNSNQS